MTNATIRRIGRNLTDGRYLLACTHWAWRKLTTIQVHHVYMIDLVTTTACLPADEHLEAHVLATVDDLRGLPPGIEQQLNEQTGQSCLRLLQRGARIYYFSEGEVVACQLNILRDEVIVDSPCDLAFRFEPEDTFLNYLHTRERYRGRGLARTLIRHACADLAAVGSRRCFAHIRATNHPSLTAFRNAGWKLAGRIVTTTSKRFIAAPGCKESRMQVRAIRSA
jgi:GNAT superfamily N-acetyltransferase